MKNLELVSWRPERQGDTLHIDLTVRTSRPLLHQDSVELQNEIGAGLQAAGVLNPNDIVQVAVNQIITARLDPLVPPTLTPTFTPTLTNTPGPSLTPTSSPVPTSTQTPIPTNTITPSPTTTRTQTPTATPTPAQAHSLNTVLPGLWLRQWPNGPVIGPLLRNGSSLTVLYGSEVVNGLIWVEVQDAEGRVGWLPEIYLVQVTATATATTTPPTPAP